MARRRAVQPRIHALFVIDVFPARAVIAQQHHPRGETRVIGRDRARIAKRAKVLAGIETPADDIAMRADAPALVSRTMGLRGILDHAQAVTAGDVEDRVQIGRLAIEMHGQQRAGSRGNRGLDACGVDIMGGGIRLDRDGHGPHTRDRQPCRDISVRGHDHLVARPDIERAQRKDQRIQPIGQPDRMGRAAIGGPVSLEGFDLGAKDIQARGQHTRYSGINLRLEFAVGRAEIEEGNGHPNISSKKRISSARCLRISVSCARGIFFGTFTATVRPRLARSMS